MTMPFPDLAFSLKNGFSAYGNVAVTPGAWSFLIFRWTKSNVGW